MLAKNAIHFLRDVRVELTKIVWPKWDEFIGSTIVVLFLVCIFSIYLGALDFGFSQLAKYIFSLYGGY
ncbi:MAG TPA: preprotein translocase subunit SecE [Candidatus Dependentiae bacterium]|nr:preprotein translocase subunit SecE [Candidatus Dependentiae bacterium]HRQ62244.1 preprotein translocase subunit SecE [Candidatus Dependentiae bacterium]